MYTVREMVHAVLWVKRHLFHQLTVDELTIVQKWLNPTDVCLDVGAHGGSWSVGLSKVVPHGRVYAFEALPYYAQVLQATVRILGKQNITIINQAVTSEDKRVNLVWKSPDGKPLTGMTHLASEQGYTDQMTGKKKLLEGQIDVEGVSLDTFQKRLPTGTSVRFVKIDVEGAELQVLQGATQFMDRHRPIIYLELWQEYCQRYGYSTRDLFEHMHKMEYNSFIYEEGRLINKNHATYPGYGDLYLIPEEACERCLQKVY